MRGYLEITFGPMFSGKTTKLMDKIHKYLDIHRCKGVEKRGLIINSSKDKREDIQNCEGLSTHSTSKKEISSSITCLRVRALKELDSEILENCDYIAIDEAQFFDDLVEFVQMWLDMGKHVHCSGLIADYKRKIFGDMIYLLPFADDVEQLKAYCIECQAHLMNAPFTKLRKPTGSDDVVFVSGSEHYIPVCGAHY